MDPQQRTTTTDPAVRAKLTGSWRANRRRGTFAFSAGRHDDQLELVTSDEGWSSTIMLPPALEQAGVQLLPFDGGRGLSILRPQPLTSPPVAIDAPDRLRGMM